jgi:hypothetical protein
VRTDGGVTIENQGLWDFVTSGGEIYANSPSGVFINGANGILRCSNGSGGPANRGPGGTFIDEGGRLEATNGATLLIQFGGTSGGINNSVASTVWDQTYGTIAIGGSWSNLYGVAVGAKLEVSVGAAKPGGMKINITGEGVRWSTGVMTPGSHGIENEGTMYYEAAGLRDLKSGIFHNSGTFIHTATAGLEIDGSGATFVNSGRYEAGAATARFIYSRNAGNTFSNLASGVFIQTVTGSVAWDGTSTAGTFRNQGTLVVTNGGTHSMSSSKWVYDSATASGGILKEGTWNVMGTLNMPLGSGSVNTINTNATVILDALGTGSINAITEASLTTVYGKFGLYRNKQWTTGGTLTTDSGTRFEFGLDNSGSDAKLTVGASSTIQGTIDVQDLGSLPAGDYTVIELAAGQTLTDGGITAGTLTTSQDLVMTLTVTPGVAGTVVLGIAPPPAGMVLYFE